MRQTKNFFCRFSERAPLLYLLFYLLVVCIGGGWLVVAITWFMLFLVSGGESLGFFRNVPLGLGLAWIIWRVFKYAYSR